MGTQQILLIVLSVIIVGIAAAVGIQMFQTQAENSNRTACAGDIQNFAAQVIAYYKTPTSMGGLGSVATANPAADDVGLYLGWGDATVTNANGTYTITCAAGVVTITGDPIETNVGNVVGTVTFANVGTSTNPVSIALN